ncbi:competence protein ComEC [Rhodoblastus sp. 17X3]|uniref:competence protein ComEC n=1 Tax=Rhodoblastus sp. 17X3 TaxID=3047026 RepID=UPI0024B75C4D|nr:competence protein ComEC [Rhodoblastus sp. 17X3]MDI9847640.1 competence protein ComEC [Rhodoblastus sp. 17X3]
MIGEVDFLPAGESNADAICVRYGDQQSGWYLHVIDGGYKDTADTIINHIDEHYGRDWHINHMVLTHADNDHATGLIGVMERKRVLNLWMNRPWLYVDEVSSHFHGNFNRAGLIGAMKARHEYLVRLEELATEQGTVIREVFQGAKIGPFTVLAPSRERYLRLIPDLDKTPQKYSEQAVFTNTWSKLMEAVKEWIDEHWHIETLSNSPEPVSASNETSVVQLGDFNGEKLLLTGDAGPQALNEAADYAQSLGLLNEFPKYVQVPHHGSRKNVTPAVLDRWLGPKMQLGERYGHAFCSVGSEQEDYPRGQVNNAFIRRGYPVWVTKGQSVCQSFGMGMRSGFVPADPLPWSDRVKV